MEPTDPTPGPGRTAAAPDRERPSPAVRISPAPRPFGRRALVAIGLLAATGAVLGALFVASQTYLSMLDHGHSWWRLVVWQLGGWGFWALAAPAIVAAGGNLLAGELRPRRLALHAVASPALATVQVTLAAAIGFSIQPFEPVAAFSFGEHLTRQFASWFWIDLLIYWALLAAGYGLGATRRQRRLELRESRLEAELARAQLEALRLEIQPHFLFNTLNSIAALVRKGSNSEALDMVLGLSELLRSTLDRSDRQLVPLGEELAFVRRYVDLQRARYGDRLAVRYDVPEACCELEVPSLVLQPLVENSIRHGVGRRAPGGTVEIRAAEEEGVLRLEIADDGEGLPAGFRLATAAGVGLSNTRSRLAQLYGEGARLELRPRPGGGAVATLRLPATFAAPRPAAPSNRQHPADPGAARDADRPARAG